MVLYICERLHENILNSFHLTELTGVYDGNDYVNAQRARTPKVGNSELQFMCSVRRLIMLYICVKFHEKYHKRYQSYGADTSIW